MVQGGHAQAAPLRRLGLQGLLASPWCLVTRPKSPPPPLKWKIPRAEGLRDGWGGGLLLGGAEINWEMGRMSCLMGWVDEKCADSNPSLLAG